MNGEWGSTISTVDVRVVNGTYKPCDKCYWFNVCAVPKGKYNMSIGSLNARNIYRCEEYTIRKIK